MILNTFLCVFSAVLFVICALLFVSQAIYALDFRKKIALTHGFSEAVMVGPYYPLLIISFSLIFIQFVSFIAVGFTTESSIIIRMFAYISSIVLFLYFRYKTPPLLTYWLGKTCLWRKAGFAGKIPYSEIVGIQLSKNVVFPITDTQKLCKITLFINPDFGSCKKISCCVTAYDLEALSKQIDVFPPDYNLATVSRAKRFSFFLVPILLFFVYILAFLLSSSSGIFNPYRYICDNRIVSEEVKTVTSVTEVGVSGDRLAVYYEKIGVINVYDTNGSFVYAIACPSSFLKAADFSVTDDGIINYRSAGVLYRYSAVDGTPLSETPIDESTYEILRTTTDKARFDYTGIYYTDESGAERAVITRPFGVAFFNVEIIWCGLALLIAVSFTMRFFSLRRKRLVCSI